MTSSLTKPSASAFFRTFGSYLKVCRRTPLHAARKTSGCSGNIGTTGGSPRSATMQGKAITCPTRQTNFKAHKALRENAAVGLIQFTTTRDLKCSARLSVEHLITALRKRETCGNRFVVSSDCHVKPSEASGEKTAPALALLAEPFSLS